MPRDWNGRRHLGRRNAFRLEGLFIFLHVRHVREEKEEEEHDGRIKKNKGYTTTRLCWRVLKRKELKSFLKFKRPALFIFWKIIARKGLADGNVFVYNIKISIITGIMELQRDKEINRRRKSAFLVHSFDCTYMNRIFGWKRTDDQFERDYPIDRHKSSSRSIKYIVKRFLGCYFPLSFHVYLLAVSQYAPVSTIRF